ncbi:unnamed protein product [Agarophyton chilense]
MDATLRRYKADFYSRVKATASFAHFDFVLFKKPCIRIMGIADEETSGCKLLPRTIGPFRVFKATYTTVTILNGTLHDTVSIDRATKAPWERTPLPTPQVSLSDHHAKNLRPTPAPVVNSAVLSRERIVWPYLTATINQPGTPTTDMLTDVAIPSELMYDKSCDLVVSKVTDKAVATDGTPIARARWYGFLPLQNSWKPAVEIPHNFTNQF